MKNDPTIVDYQRSPREGEAEQLSRSDADQISRNRTDCAANRNGGDELKVQCLSLLDSNPLRDAVGEQADDERGVDNLTGRVEGMGQNRDQP